MVVFLNFSAQSTLFHSTETALLLSLSRGDTTALAWLDLSAAFDTLDLSTLFRCLHIWFSVGGSILKWFTSYLADRCQSVKIGSTLSDVCKLLFGIPQGSVLGSSHCTPPLSAGIKFQSHADNSQVYVDLSQKNASAAIEQLNRCLNDVKEWNSTS